MIMNFRIKLMQFANHNFEQGKKFINVFTNI